MPYVISGGKSIMYASMLTLDLRKQAVLDSDPISKEEGLKVKVTCRKNHCVCTKYPYGAVEYYARYGKGIAWDLELIQAALDMGFITQKGAWMYEIDQATGDTALDENGQQLKWNGKNAFKEYLANNESYREKLEAMVNGTFEVEALSDQELKEIQSDEVDIANTVSEFNPVEDNNVDPIELSKKSKNKK